MNTLILILVIAVIITAIAFLGGFLLLKFALFRRPENDGHTFEELMLNPFNTLESRKRIKWFFEQKNEGKVKTVEIKSFDGLRLQGMLLNSEKPTGKTIICFHGYTGNGDNEYAPFVKYFYANGFNTLVVDLRGHSFSEGKYITMGVFDRYDVKSWVDFVISSFGASEKIYLHGISMGAASVTMATELGLPKNVRGIIADCGYTTPYEIMKIACRTYYKTPAFPFFYVAGFLCKLICKWNFKGASALEAMKKNETIPMLFIHGGQDPLIPCSMTKANYEACAAPKTLYICEEASHAESYYKCMEKYEQVMTEFFTVNN